MSLTCVVGPHTPAPSRGSTGLAGVSTHTPSRVAPPVGRHQRHPQGSSKLLLTYWFCGRNTVQLDFLTVRGSGHMVPEYKPMVTLEFLSRWLAGQPWRPYRPDALDGAGTPQPVN